MAWTPFRRTWKSKPTEYNGILFDSKSEADYAKKLDQHGIEYKRQITYDIPDLNGNLKWSYTCDFQIKEYVVEIKGYIDAIEKYKYAYIKYYLENTTPLKFKLVYSTEKKHKRTGKILRKQFDIDFLL